MPRPQRCRRICVLPKNDTFNPTNCRNNEPVVLTLDEYEVIRLVDLEEKTHEQCARTNGYIPFNSTGNLRKCKAKAGSLSGLRAKNSYFRRELPYLCRQRA